MGNELKVVKRGARSIQQQKRKQSWVDTKIKTLLFGNKIFPNFTSDPYVQMVRVTYNYKYLPGYSN